MRRLSLGVSLVLAACAAPRLPLAAETSGRQCKPDGADRFVGQTAASEIGAAIMRASNAAVLRWAPPGAMLTMDYREDRVTVRLGPDGKVSAIDCG